MINRIICLRRKIFICASDWLLEDVSDMSVFSIDMHPFGEVRQARLAGSISGKER